MINAKLNSINVVLMLSKAKLIIYQYNTNNYLMQN